MSEAGGVSHIRKVETGILGLDEILRGGVPEGKTTLVSGGPGCGKSVLGLQFLCHGAEAGAAGIYITFEERVEDVRRNAASIGLDIPALEESGMLFVMDARVDRQAVLAGDFDISGLLSIIGGKVEQLKASRIVIDAVDVLMSLFGEYHREKREIYGLHDWLIEQRLTTILTAKLSRDPQQASQYEFLDYLADCAIVLDSRVEERVSTRWLRVLKFRGSDIGRNEYPFLISGTGIQLAPVTSVRLKHKALGPYVSTGCEELDRMVGGGYRQGSCVLLSGPTGTGKTTLAATFARGACMRGEKVLYINMEQSRDAMVSCMLSPGVDLSRFLENGTLEIHAALPEAVGAEEHLFHALAVIERLQPRHVVLDAISSCLRLGPTALTASSFVLRLSHACKDEGTTSILINQAAGLNNVFSGVTGIDVSSLIDTVVALGYVRQGGEVNRTILVLKSRGSAHSNQKREFRITDSGIDIVRAYGGEGGGLTGITRMMREAEEEEGLQERTREIASKEGELEVMQARFEAERALQDADVRVAQLELDRLKRGLHVDHQAWDRRISLRGGGGPHELSGETAESVERDENRGA